MFRNFKRELPAILEKSPSIIRNFYAEWKKNIMREIDTAMPLDKVEAGNDLSQFALYRMMQRFFFERGEAGLEDILKFWKYISEKHRGEREQKEKAH